MAVKFRDYYEVLGVPRTATEDQIRSEYRRLARKHHPDVNPGDRSSEDKFKEINEAYEVLSDSDKRKRYDQLGANWKAGADFNPPPGSSRVDFGDIFGQGDSGQNGAGAFSDFFESMFGRAGRGAGAGFRTQGRDIEAEIPITLQEAHRGVTRTISLEASETCPDCNGTGTKDGKTCPRCRGAGAIRRTKTIEVTIPPGVREGSIIRLAGQGDAGAGRSRAGDLFLHARIQPDPLFELVDDDDIQIELPVAPWEASLGAKVLVPTLDGSVEMTIRAGTQGGQRLRLRGQGLARRGGGRGDEYVRIKLVNPPKLNAKETELYRQLAAESRFNPRDLLPKR
jgi:curved DNA-binding protein